MLLGIKYRWRAGRSWMTWRPPRPQQAKFIRLALRLGAGCEGQALPVCYVSTLLTNMNCTCKFSRSCCKLQTCRDTNFLSIKNQTGRASVGRTRLCGPCPTRLQASSASVGRTRLWTMILDPCLCGPCPTRLQPQPACLGPGIIYGPVWAQSVAYGNSGLTDKLHGNWFYGSPLAALRDKSKLI